MTAVQIPVRLFALPLVQTFDTDFQGNKLDKPRVSYKTQAIMGADAVTLYADQDPTDGLNGSKKKLEAGQMIDVLAEFRAYPRKSGIGLQLERFVEAGQH